MIFASVVGLGADVIDPQTVFRFVNSIRLPWSYDDAFNIAALGLDAMNEAVQIGDDQGLPGATRRNTVRGKMQFHVSNADDPAHGSNDPYMGSWDLKEWLTAAIGEYNAVADEQSRNSFFSRLSEKLRSIRIFPDVDQKVRDAADILAAKTKEALASLRPDLIQAASDAGDAFSKSVTSRDVPVSVSFPASLKIGLALIAIAGISYTAWTFFGHPTSRLRRT